MRRFETYRLEGVTLSTMQSQTLRSVSVHHGYVTGRDVDSKLQKPKLMELGLGGMTKMLKP